MTLVSQNGIKIGIYLGYRNNIMDLLRILFLFFFYELFRFVFKATFSIFVVTKRKQISDMCSHWVHVASNNFIQIFKLFITNPQ